LSPYDHYDATKLEGAGLKMTSEVPLIDPVMEASEKVIGQLEID
jgi:hypothetical protein